MQLKKIGYRFDSSKLDCITAEAFALIGEMYDQQMSKAIKNGG